MSANKLNAVGILYSDSMVDTLCGCDTVQCPQYIGITYPDVEKRYNLCTRGSKVISGAYNVLYREEGSPDVLILSIKWLQQLMMQDVSDADRIYRLFKEIYGQTIADHMCRVIYDINGQAFAYLTPYIEDIKSKAASDIEVFNEILRIFLKTGRIVYDAVGEDNTVKVDINGVETVICRDVEMARRHGSLSVVGGARARAASYVDWLDKPTGYSFSKPATPRVHPRSDDLKASTQSYAESFKLFKDYYSDPAYTSYKYSVNLLKLLTRLCVCYPLSKVHAFADSLQKGEMDPHLRFEDLMFNDGCGARHFDLLNDCELIRFLEQKMPAYAGCFQDKPASDESKLDGGDFEESSTSTGVTQEESDIDKQKRLLLDVLNNIKLKSGNKDKRKTANILHAQLSEFRADSDKDDTYKLNYLKVIYILTLRMATHHTNIFRTRNGIDLSEKSGPKTYVDNYSLFQELAVSLGLNGILGKVVHDKKDSLFEAGNYPFLKWKAMRKEYRLDGVTSDSNRLKGYLGSRAKSFAKDVAAG